MASLTNIIGKTKVLEDKTIEINNNKVVIKSYLPLQKQIDLLQLVVNNFLEDNTYFNPIKFEVIFTILAINSFTDITFTEKQRTDNLYKTWDSLHTSDALKVLIENMPELYWTLKDYAVKTIGEIFNYSHSLKGIIESVVKNKEINDLNAEELVEKVKDPNVEHFLKNLIDSNLQ